MIPFTQSMRDALAFTLSDPAPIILVVKSRSQGRRMLQWLSRQGKPLVNVTVETPKTLAAAICASALSQPDAPTAMEPTEAMNLIRILLSELKGGYYKDRPAAQTAAAARLFYYTFQELALAGISGFPGFDSGKLGSTQHLRNDYIQRKTELGLLDGADLLALAIQQVEHCIQYRGAKFVTLDCFQFSTLEQSLIQKVSGGRLHTVALPQQSQRTATNSRFVACRGVENEVDFVFRDILEQGKAIEDCAVVYLSSEYGGKLWNSAHRWGVPASMAGGLFLGDTALYATLSGLSQWSKRGYPVEPIYRLLNNGNLGPQRAGQLARILARKDAFLGQQLYTLIDGERPKGLDDAIWKSWVDFLALMLEVVDDSKEMEEQKVALQRLLSLYIPRRNPNQIAVRATAQTLVETAYTAAQRLEDLENISLLEHLIHLMEGASYLPAPTVTQKTDANLLCMPLYQALLSGRSTLYVVGLSRYALEQGGSESPILLDEERVVLGGLSTVASRAKERKAIFDQLVSTHSGDMICSYSDYDSTVMMALLPSPVYIQMRAEQGVQEEKIDYIAKGRLLASDALMNGERFAHSPFPMGDPNRNQEDVPGLKEVIKDFRFSPSSMEMAYRCPLKFYLQYILHIKTDKVQAPNNSWLPPTTLGTAAHEVLENYFAALVEKKTPVVDDLIQATQKSLKDTFPCYNRRMEILRDQELQLLEQFVKDAIKVYDGSNFQVCATEQSFGQDLDGQGNIKGMELTVGNNTVKLSGIIDRVDRDKTTGKYSILDYKTSKVDGFLAQHETHLQHYLYTLAYEKLFPGRDVDSARYQLLRDEGKCQVYEQSQQNRDIMAGKIGHLLSVLGNERTIETSCPCYQTSGTGVVQDSMENRSAAREECMRNCEYSDFCESQWEGAKK